MLKRLGLLALGTIAGTAMLAGCGGLRQGQNDMSPIVEPGAILQARTIAEPVGNGKSWMSPEAGSKSLLYVSASSSVLVYNYGTTNQVGTLSYFSHAAGECTDATGNVYVTNWGAADVLEFAHGGSKPIKTLIDPDPYPFDCAIDPSTGNLAVINEYGRSEYSPGNVAIYAGAKGKPKTYKINGFVTYTSGSYDSSGNLLVSAFPTASGEALFAMLEKGGKAFQATSLERSGNFKSPGYVRWDGEYFVVEWNYFGISLFEWYTIANYQGTYQGYMLTEESSEGSGPYWLGRIGGPKSVPRANQLVAAEYWDGVLGWNYPRGGSYIFTIGNSHPGGVTASSAR